MENSIKKPKRKAIRRGTKVKRFLTKPASPENRIRKPTTHKPRPTKQNKVPGISDQNNPIQPINDAKNIENTDNVIAKIADQKEENLVNLIVKVLVRSTLEELYGKESN